jgi:hypothetical protein
MASHAPVAAMAPADELHHHTPTHAVVDGTARSHCHPESPHPVSVALAAPRSFHRSIDWVSRISAPSR